MDILAQPGECLRVIATGKFYGQIAKVLRVHPVPGGRIFYKLDVTWNGVSRPSSFEQHEVEVPEAAQDQA